MAVAHGTVDHNALPNTAPLVVPIDLLPYGALALDDRGNAYQANRVWSELTGLRAEETLGGGWANAILAEDRPHVLAHLDDMPASIAARPKRWRLHRADGRVVWTLWGVSDLPVPIAMAAHRHRLVSIADIDAEHRVQMTLLYAATHDNLTGALRRSAFLQQLDHALARLRRHPSIVSLLFIDLDQFKTLNDRYGHLAGDRILAAQADRIRAALRPSDVLGRLGGDEFVVICDELSTRTEAETIAARVADALAAPIDIDGATVGVPASVGLAVTDDVSITPDELLASADRAMYRAKRRGGGRVEVASGLTVLRGSAERLPGHPTESTIDGRSIHREADLIGVLSQLEGAVRALWAAHIDDDTAATNLAAVGRHLAHARTALGDGALGIDERPALETEPARTTPGHTTPT